MKRNSKKINFKNKDKDKEESSTLIGNKEKIDSISENKNSSED